LALSYEELSTRLQNYEAALERERSLFSTGPVVVFRWLAKEGWPVEYVSENVKEHLSADAESLLSGKVLFSDLIHPKDIERIQNEFLEFTSQKLERFEQEYRLLCKEGRYCWFRDYSVIHYDGDGKPQHIDGYLLDVSGYKATEKELKRIKDNLVRGQSVAKLGSWELDLGSGRLWWSDEIYKIFGMNPSEFEPTYEAFLSTVHPDDVEAVQIAVNSSIENKTPYEITHRILLKDGTLKTVLEKGESVFDEGGNAVKMVGVVHDITYQVRANEAVRRSEEKFRTIFNQSHDGLVIIDPIIKRFVEFNARAHEQLGYSADEFSKLWVDEIDVSDTPEDIKKRIEKIKKQGWDIFETKHRTKTGEILDIIVVVNLMMTESGPLLVCNFRDITESKREKDELEAAKRASEEADRAKSEFLANMSHEIRTPLNAVLGFAELLKKENHTKKTAELVDGILLSGRNLLSLINDILDLSKIEAGKMELDEEPVDLRRMAAELEVIFLMKAKEKGITLSVLIDESTSSLVMLDETRVRQILFNFLGNAIKFTEHGGVKLSVGSIPNPKNSELVDVTISVEDSGIGIPSTQLEAIFGAFKQMDGQSTRRYGGTGLGLAISKKLADIMGAKIDVSSSVGVGSKFTLLLDGIRPALVNVNEKAQNTPPILLGGSVLIVEDIDTNREVVKGFLSSQNVRIYEAVNGLEGYEAAKKYLPDIVLMDMQMPVMDGYDSTKLIKNDPLTKGVKVVALTASTVKSESGDFMQLCDGFLQKPIDSYTLISELAKHLPSKQDTQIKEQEAGGAELLLKLSEDEKKDVAAALREAYKKASELKSNDEIEEFAKIAKEYAKKLSSKALLAYADELTEACESFKIVKINQIFDSFEILLREADATK